MIRGVADNLASALLALSAAAYSLMTGEFPYYDPLLMRILGILLSLGGLAPGISGIWRTSSLARMQS